jgi:hypothetical protein
MFAPALLKNSAVNGTPFADMAALSRKGYTLMEVSV